MKPVTKAVLWILVVFLAGTLFGGGMTSLLLPRTDRVVSEPGRDETPGRSRGDSERSNRPSMLERLTTAAQLEPHQVEAVREILHAGGERYEEIENNLGEEKRRLRSEVRRQNREQIRALLSPEQLSRFEAFLEQLHQEWEQRQQKRDRSSNGRDKDERDGRNDH